MELKNIFEDSEFLRQKSKEVSFSSKAFKKDIVCLEEVCKHTGFKSLSAIQIGIPKKIIYINNGEQRVLINPEIVSQKGETKSWEYCPSCLEFAGFVSRPYEIEVEYYDEKGNLQSDIFEGKEASTIAHEIDHLNGTFHVDIAERIANVSIDKLKKLRTDEPYTVISQNNRYRQAPSRINK